MGTQTDDNEVIETADDSDGEPYIGETPRWVLGWPKGAVRKIVVLTKEYNLRSRNTLQASTPVIELFSDDDAEPHESLYAFLASEIPLSQAVTGPETLEWKNLQWNEESNSQRYVGACG